MQCWNKTFGSVLEYRFIRAATKDQTIHNSYPMTSKQRKNNGYSLVNPYTRTTKDFGRLTSHPVRGWTGKNKAFYSPGTQKPLCDKSLFPKTFKRRDLTFQSVTSLFASITTRFLDLFFREFSAAINFPCSNYWLKTGENDVILSKIPQGLKS